MRIPRMRPADIFQSMPLRKLLLARRSGVDAFTIGRLPAPCAGAVSALGDPLLVDLGDDLAVAGQERLGRTHLRTERQLALGEAVGAVFLVLRRAAVGLGAAGAEAVAAADAQILGVQHHAVGGGVEAVHRAHRRAGRVGAVHAGHRDRALAGLAVIDGDDTAPVDAPGHLVLVLAGGYAGVAFDATVSVAEKFHPS